MHAHNRINLDDPAELLLWADHLEITVERLREIVARVGPMAPSVAFYAKKSGQERKGAPVTRQREPHVEPCRSNTHDATASA
jgi:Protein of unknown function (DUF3606)